MARGGYRSAPPVFLFCGTDRDVRHSVRRRVAPYVARPVDARSHAVRKLSEGRRSCSREREAL